MNYKYRVSSFHSSPLLSLSYITTNNLSEERIQTCETNILYFIHFPFLTDENYLLWTIGLKFPLIILEHRMSVEGGEVNNEVERKITWHAQAIYLLRIGAENQVRWLCIALIYFTKGLSLATAVMAWLLLKFMKTEVPRVMEIPVHILF